MGGRDGEGGGNKGGGGDCSGTISSGVRELGPLRKALHEGESFVPQHLPATKTVDGSVDGDGEGRCSSGMVKDEVEDGGLQVQRDAAKVLMPSLDSLIH